MYTSKEPPAKEKKEESAEIDSKVAAFLKNGGKIQQIPRGRSAVGGYRNKDAQQMAEKNK